MSDSIICSGSFIDRVSESSIYQIDTFTVRLAPDTYDLYLSGKSTNCRDCYIDGEAGDREYEAFCKRREGYMASFKARLLDVVGISPENAEKVRFAQAFSEIFTVVNITQFQ